MTLKEYLQLIDEFGLKLADFRYENDYTAYLLGKYPVCNYRKKGCAAFYEDNSILFYQPKLENWFDGHYNSGAFNGRAYEDYTEAKRKFADHLKEVKKQLVQLKVQEIEKDFENDKPPFCEDV
jgi:hypothetical protein